MLFYIVIGTVFLFIVAFVLFLGLPVLRKKGTKSAVSRISFYSTIAKKDGEEIPSFFQRVMVPFLSKIASFVKRISPKGVIAANKRRLELAGSSESFSVDLYLAVKFLFPVGFLFLLIIMVLFFDISFLGRILLLILIPVSYFLPDFYVRSKIASRQKDMRKSLPNALDLLSVSVEAGMGFDSALSRVAKNVGGALGEEFNRMLQDIQLGLSRKEAFQELNKRTDVSELSTFILAMTQADIFGIPISKVLKIQASEMRTKRRQMAEEAGMKAPVLLVFPLILCLFPAMMVVIIGPAAIRIYYTVIDMLSP
ncbi:MAG: type II secretion system F family protein [Actinomycetota bacterium]|nr:MAG: type II secretion system F family protein [Actinomycetota bacterium]